MTIWNLAMSNLLSIPILCFVLGFIATRVKSDLQMPESIMKFLTFYLLLAIGIKGGVSLQKSELAEVAWPVITTIILGIVLPIFAFAVLRFLTTLDRQDRGAIAAHYGSTSLVTFTAALVFLETANIFVEGYVVTLLAVMEVPGIIVGLMLAGSNSRKPRELLASAREVLTSPSIALLVGGVAIGYAAGPDRFKSTEPFFSDIFVGMLSLFLLQMGVTVAKRISSFASAGPGLVLFAVLFPLVAGSAGVTAGSALDLGVGGAAMLGVLCASASYIAAPAAVRLALPMANDGLAITCSLAVTFPINMVAGIPLMVFFARTLGA